MTSLNSYYYQDVSLTDFNMTQEQQLNGLTGNTGRKSSNKQKPVSGEKLFEKFFYTNPVLPLRDRRILKMLSENKLKSLELSKNSYSAQLK